MARDGLRSSFILTAIVCKVGDERNAVVLHVDSVASCVQLTFSKDTLKAVRAFKENKFTQVSVSVLLVTLSRELLRLFDTVSHASW